MDSEDGEHIIEAMGRCRIQIRNGKIVDAGDPIIHDCPLARRFVYPIPAMTREHIIRNIEYRIRTFGMCTSRREVTDRREWVGFGVTEILSSSLDAGLLDAVVLVCDGAGTVVAPAADLVQGIGGRMSGLVSTSAIPAVIERIERRGGIVVDKTTARIDQPAGVGCAVTAGFRQIAVTVADPDTAELIRREYPETVIAAVHLSGLSPGGAERLVAASDLVTACASEPIREIAGRRALVQAGTAIPVFAVTARGKQLIIGKLARSSEPFVVRTAQLPVAGDLQPDPLV